MRLWKSGARDYDELVILIRNGGLKSGDAWQMGAEAATGSATPCDLPFFMSEMPPAI